MKRDAKPATAMPASVRKLRCAVYTRKSSEEGLDMEFNSLDAQREACEAFIASQRAEGWVLVRDRYDDGGISGGTLERPALKRLVADIQEGLVDVVVVYKIDRLSRSLVDFTKLVEVFDANSVTFVSVTQSFNTTTSMGRLTLNILLSFAQFEREVIGERIRDKVAASRKRGMWMGGFVPLGYDVRERKLVANDAEATLVRRIFQGFVETESCTKLVQVLRAEGATTKRGRPLTKSDVYRILSNRVYLDEAVHKGTAYDMEADKLAKALDVLEAPWPLREEALLREQFKDRSGPAAARSLRLVEWILATGLERFEPPAPLPPISDADVRLVCWMAVEAETDVSSLGGKGGE
jgi:site-specific DNA recombinase